MKDPLTPLPPPPHPMQELQYKELAPAAHGGVASSGILSQKLDSVEMITDFLAWESFIKYYCINAVGGGGRMGGGEGDYSAYSEPVRFSF